MGPGCSCLRDPQNTSLPPDLQRWWVCGDDSAWEKVQSSQLGSWGRHANELCGRCKEVCLFLRAQLGYGFGLLFMLGVAVFFVLF